MVSGGGDFEVELWYLVVGISTEIMGIIGIGNFGCEIMVRRGGNF